MMGRSGERGSGISVLATRHDDDEEATMKLNAFILTGYLIFQPLSIYIYIYIWRNGGFW